jgi:hypothetical protein
MQNLRNFGIVLAFGLLISAQGQDRDVAKEFFRRPLADRMTRLRQYSLEDQYKIFRYGMDNKEPPFMDFANPIAERGAKAVPFLLNQLNSHTDDITTRDLLLIFETMAHSKSYEVRSDVALMTTLVSKVSAMKDKEWQESCSKSIQRIRTP